MMLNNGEQLRMVRKGYQMRQEQIAQRIGVSKSYIGHIENGERKLSKELAENIAAALELTPTKFEAIEVADKAYKAMQLKLCKK